MYQRPNGATGARVIQVIETKAPRGTGVEKDPIREVTQYWDLEGKFLAERDVEEQYLADLATWEYERLNKIIEEQKAAFELQRD